jgi:hypothetical protein
MRFFAEAIILVPLAVLPIAFAIGNSESVNLSFDPFSTDARAYAIAAHRRWPDLHRQIHCEAQKAAIPRLEDVPAQPCRWNRIDRSVCRSDDLIPDAIRLPVLGERSRCGGSQRGVTSGEFRGMAA